MQGSEVGLKREEECPQQQPVQQMQRQCPLEVWRGLPWLTQHHLPQGKL